MDFVKRPHLCTRSTLCMQFLPEYQNTYVFYLFWIFVGLIGFQVLYSIFFFGRLAFLKNNQEKHLFPPVSVVIAARNESDNLYENLPKLLTQDYPAPFEVVVVNHQSIDDSKYLLEALQRQYPNLSVMDVERSKHLPASKKFPLTMGIKKAKYEHLLLTDADCAPTSEQWLSKMAGKFSEKHEIILGYLTANIPVF